MTVSLEHKERVLRHLQLSAESVDYYMAEIRSLREANGVMVMILKEIASGRWSKENAMDLARTAAKRAMEMAP